MGLTAGVTVAAGATVARCRIGARAGGEAAEASGGDAAGRSRTPRWRAVASGRAGSSGPVDQSRQPHGESPSPRRVRWTGRVGMGVREVRLGTVETCATTRPGGRRRPRSRGPAAARSAAAGGGPDTSARNGVAGATSGGGADGPLDGRQRAPRRRWPARVRGAAGRSEAARPVTRRRGRPPACREGCPSDGVLRPNGHGRRTGLTPPRTGAC